MENSFFLEKDPFQHFQRIFAEAESKIPHEPNAMQLATVGDSGHPSCRTVLYKGLVRNGFSFYTNYESTKAKHLMVNKNAALNFYWPQLYIQIRIEGVVEKLTRKESENYFSSRPRLSQIGAWASEQSQSIPNSMYLEKKY